MVTHELRTPLAVVRAYLDLLATRRTRPSDADERRRTATPPGAGPGPGRGRGAIRRSAQVTRLDRLVDSILASVRGEGLAAGLARVPFDIARAVNDTIDEMTPLLRGHSLRRDGTWDDR